MLKPLFFSLHNCKAVRKIVRNKTHSANVGKLKKCGKFETIKVSS